MLLSLAKEGRCSNDEEDPKDKDEKVDEEFIRFELLVVIVDGFELMEAVVAVVRSSLSLASTRGSNLFKEARVESLKSSNRKDSGREMGGCCGWFGLIGSDHL